MNSKECQEFQTIPINIPASEFLQNHLESRKDSFQSPGGSPNGAALVPQTVYARDSHYVLQEISRRMKAKNLGAETLDMAYIFKTEVNSSRLGISV